MALSQSCPDSASRVWISRIVNSRAHLENSGSRRSSATASFANIRHAASGQGRGRGDGEPERRTEVIEAPGNLAAEARDTRSLHHLFLCERERGERQRVGHAAQTTGCGHTALVRLGRSQRLQAVECHDMMHHAETSGEIGSDGDVLAARHCQRHYRHSTPVGGCDGTRKEARVLPPVSCRTASG